ncbi:hypothetical protein, partial [Salmonella enterica]|uniref:hypothetical protein n=1 Tax=Salmonella enterica TaxID=28901 RepID=UPI0020C417F4
KIDGEIVIDELRAVLERLVGDQTLRRQTGKAARAWALKTLNAARYAETIERLAEVQITSRPLLSVGRRIGGELNAMGLSAGD